MKNLGYIKKYLFETIKPQAIHQYFLIEEKKVKEEKSTKKVQAKI